MYIIYIIQQLHHIRTTIYVNIYTIIYSIYNKICRQMICRRQNESRMIERFKAKKSENIDLLQIEKTCSEGGACLLGKIRHSVSDITSM